MMVLYISYCVSLMLSIPILLPLPFLCQKMREEDMWNTCKVNQIPKVEIWEIYEISLDLKKKMEIFIF